MMEAARLYYMEDLNMREVSERMSVSYDTIRRYFSQEDMDQFKRFYSDQELFKLEQSLEQDIRDGEQLANNLLARAIQHDDADDKTFLRASDQALKIRERKVKLLQELGIKEKPKERREVKTESVDSTEDKLAEYYEQKMKEEEERKEEVEAE